MVQTDGSKNLSGALRLIYLTRIYSLSCYQTETFYLPQSTTSGTNIKYCSLYNICQYVLHFHYFYHVLTLNASHKLLVIKTVKRFKAKIEVEIFKSKIFPQVFIQPNMLFTLGYSLLHFSQNCFRASLSRLVKAPNLDFG